MIASTLLLSSDGRLNSRFQIMCGCRSSRITMQPAIDGKLSTKCCWLNVNADGREPSWRVLVVRLPDGTRAESYSFTAANNYLPERNPSAWTMESSANGADWEVVDVRNVNQQDTPSRAHVEFNRMMIR